MNLPKYPARETLPNSSEIQKLIEDAMSFDAAEFNTEAVRLVGEWHASVDTIVQTEVLKQQAFLRLRQTSDDPIASTVLVTARLEIIFMEEERKKIGVTTITDLGMTAVNEDIGLVFVTGGDISDECNEGLFVPISHTSNLRVSSHLLVSS